MKTDFEPMEPDEILHWLDRFGVRYKIHKGAFVTDSNLLVLSDSKQSLPRLKASIEEHADALADLVKTRTPAVCDWCHLPIAHGSHRIRVYSADDGCRRSLHPTCYSQRAEKHPNLPDAEVLFDEPGYTMLIEDSGACCYCQVGEAVMPEDCPSVCNRCWKIRSEANERDRAVSGAAPVA